MRILKFRVISTHASLAGGDIRDELEDIKSVQISTHASLAGGDLVCPTCGQDLPEFQPTPPSREATAIVHNFT